MGSSKHKKESIGTLRECLIKFVIILFTSCIGLWCGWNDSYGSFYIAVLVQAINNMYEATVYFKGYSRFITIFQVMSFVLGAVAVILSIIHFTDGGKVVDNIKMVLAISFALSIPVLHYAIEAYNIIRKEQY